MADGVIDLGNAVERQRAIDALDEAKAEAALAERFGAWDRAMARAFKGIVPRPERMRGLKRAIDRQ
jgi:hypothetical protein